MDRVSTNGRLSALAHGLALVALLVPGGEIQGQTVPVRQDTLRAPPVRDAVGDLNAESVQRGSFPGAIVLPGTQVSLAIGGFIKAAGIFDSNLETSGAMLLPGNFVPGAEAGGNFSMDATKTRLFFDGRAPVADGSIRGYVEWDFNATNNGVMSFAPRLAYGIWQSSRGTLTAGHDWSTLMDLKVIPESMTEPTVSGAVLSRQALIRWSQNVGAAGGVHVAIEDASASDIAFGEGGIGKTGYPDLVVGGEVRGESGHVRASGILRRLENREAEGEDPATGWGVTVSGRLNWGGGSERIAFQASHGKGIARYILGVGPGTGGFVEPETGALDLLKSWGGIVALRHGWTATTRSSAGFGGARAEVLDDHPDDAFRESTYGFVNLLHSPFPYLTMGAEYAFGRMKVKSGDTTDNHRFVFGVQIF